MIRICDNRKYLKNIADTSVTKCDEIIIVIDIVSTKKTNTIATKKKQIQQQQMLRVLLQ